MGVRERSGIDARLVVVGMTATDGLIADPADGGMLDGQPNVNGSRVPPVSSTHTDLFSR